MLMRLTEIDPDNERYRGRKEIKDAWVRSIASESYDMEEFKRSLEYDFYNENDYIYDTEDRKLYEANEYYHRIMTPSQIKMIIQMREARENKGEQETGFVELCEQIKKAIIESDYEGGEEMIAHIDQEVELYKRKEAHALKKKRKNRQ
ncbi:MAG: hypothetical protein IJI44_08920 [Erysipelotrichaceae bacterium]|nr:hypothetical protein [Erysipelotrichaceae bacterium]